MTRIAINGFGRIGRLFFRQVAQNPSLEIVAINDLGDLENLAYLLQYDTVYGKFEEQISIEESRTNDWGVLNVGGSRIDVFCESDPLKLPWQKLDIDIVIEATGAFESYEKAKVHLIAGAKHVVITAPAKDEDGPDGQTVLIGVNEKEAAEYKITSNGSCTTNAVSPVLEVLRDSLGIEKAILNTTHGYTATQSLVDGPVRGGDVRRGRSAAQNIVPSTTGAAIAVTRAIPSLIGKFDGISLRVPVVAGSVADLTFISKRNTTCEEVNEILEHASMLPRWKGIMKTTRDPVVSFDIIKEPYGAIVDLSFTKVVGGNLVKVLSWYDNEWGYVSTLVKHVKVVASVL